MYEHILRENVMEIQHIQYRTMKRQRSICVGPFQQNITSGNLTKTYSKPYIFLKIKVRTLLFGTVFTKLANVTKLKKALHMVIFSIFLSKVIPES